MRWLAVLAWALLLLASTVVPGHADKRVALVIGNSAYRNVPPLANPRNDAADVGAKLRELQFETIVATDLRDTARHDLTGFWVARTLAP